MVTRPPHFNAYEFVVVSALRAHQLMGGCIPHVGGDHKKMIVAQLEVAGGMISRVKTDETGKDVIPG